MIMGLLKTAKFWVIAGVIVAVIAFVKWGHGEVYDSGYNAAELKWRTAQQAAIDAAVAESARTWEIAVEEASNNITIETRIEERISYVDREVPKIVEKFVPAECRDLGPDIQRLFNDAITAAASTDLPVPGDTAVPDDGLP